MGTSIGFDIYAKDRASGTFNRVGSAAAGAGKKTSALGSLAKKGALGLGATAAAAALFVAKVGPGYVDSLNKVQALTGATDAETRKAARGLERNTLAYAKMGMTVGDASAGLVELTKAGLALRPAMDAVNGTMVLAKAGELGVAEASTLVSNTLKTFGLKASRAADVANYLANAANISSADVVDLAEAFKYAAPVAAAAGVKVETVNAMLAELANQGINASVAGTGLRNLFTSLQSPAGRGGKAIKDLGVAVFDAEGNARPFKTVLGELSEAIGKVDDKTRKADLKAIFGKEGLTSAQILLEGGTKALEEYEAGVVKAGGANRFAQSASKGLAGTLQIVKASAISGGQAMYRTLSPVADKALRPLALGFADLATKTGPAMAKFVAQGPAKLKAAFAGSGMGDQLSKTGAALAKFGQSLMPTLSKLGTEAKAKLLPALAGVGRVVTGQLLPAFRNVLPVLAPVATFLLNLLGGAVIGALQGGLRVIKGVITTISGLFNLVASVIHGDWSKAWSSLGQIVRGLGGVVIGALQVWWNMGILAVFKRGVLFLTKGIWTKLWSGLRSAGSAGMSALGSVIRAGISGYARLFLAGVRAYLGIWKLGFKVLRSAFGGAMAAIRTVVSHAVGAIKTLFSRAVSGYVGLWRKGLSTLRSAAASGLAKVVDFFKGLPGRIVSAMGNGTGLLRTVGTNIVDGFRNGLSGSWHKVTSWIRSAIDKIPAAVRKILNIHSPSRVMMTIGGQVMDGLALGLTKKWVTVGKAIKTVQGKLQGSLNKLATLKAERADFAAGMNFASSAFTADYGDAGPTAAAFLAQQQKELAKANQVKADVARLVKAGLSSSLIKQMQAGGESGIAAMHALAQGSTADIARANALNKQTEAAYAAAGATAADRLYGQGIASTEAELRMERAVLRAMRKAAKEAKSEVHVHLEGKDIVYSINRYNSKKGKK